MESILESFSKIANEEIWHSFLAWLLDQALRWCLGGRSTVARKFALLLSTVANEELVRARRVPQCGGYQEPDVAGHLGPRGLQDGEVGIAPSDWPANAEVALRAWSRSGQGNLYGSGAILIGSLTWPGWSRREEGDLQIFELGEATPNFLVVPESLVRHAFFDSCLRSPDLEPIY